ncbi:inverse autotransporter beta domain-containing protein [Yersinia rohdei]|uniref:inverse autotransporter beta domain-containing protein n=1 Tax=Yersinia rohdei TaxID=29485 RepID=UPI0011A888B3|nr:inverse autotransporter beta domain-containing protein [Yersinia rohdei]
MDKKFVFSKDFSLELLLNPSEKSSYTSLNNVRTRIHAWLMALLPLALLLSITFISAIAVAKPSVSTPTSTPTSTEQWAGLPTQPYILRAGETVATVAKRHGLTVDELKEINIYRAFSKPFVHLASGDEIDIPRKASPFSINNKNDDIPLDNKLASQAKIASTALAKGDIAQSGERLVRSAASNEFNKSAQQWLSQFGTARVLLNVNDDLHLDGSAADVLLPLYDNKESILFTQLGIRNKDNRNTVNMGGGVRTFHSDWMYGANTFFDNDLTGKNRRVGVGVEAWTDYLKLSANHYFAITDWHQSRDARDYNERPANGYDFRAESYLPSYPQLGCKVIYEAYRGDEVALFGKDSRQKDPTAITAGVNYTPIPLVTVGAEHRVGTGGQNDSSINFLLNYRLGDTWQDHIDPSAVVDSRTLTGSCYDLVERNNNIVLNYQKQSLVRLSLPESLAGDPLSLLSVTAQVVATHGLDRIDWQISKLIAAGGGIKKTSKSEVEITLPEYQINSNKYILTAIAYDTQGNISSPASMLITVNEPRINATYSTLVASPEYIESNGSDTSQVTLTLRDNNNTPVTGKAASFTSTLGTLGGVSEQGGGVYLATLTAGIVAGVANVSANVGGNALDVTPARVTLDSEGRDFNPTNSTLVAAPDNIEANGSDTSQVTLTLRDSNNTPLTGLAVSFASTLGTLGSVSEQGGGVYIATLTAGTVAGIASISASVDGNPLGVTPARITLNTTNRSPSLTDSTLVAAPDNIEANGSDTSQVTLTLRDSNNTPLTGLAVSFASSLGTLGSVSEQEGGVYIATLTAGTVAGIASISASVDGNPLGVTPATVNVVPASVNLIISVDNARKNIGQTINLTVAARYKRTNAMAPNIKLTFEPVSVVNRQNIAMSNSGLLQVAGANYNSFTGVTGADGQLTLPITDPNGIGVQTVLRAKAESGDWQEQALIFNVKTSPDSPLANMWGNMAETLAANGNTFKRPYLAGEMPTSQQSVKNNETWAIFTFNEAEALCTLPQRTDLENLYLAYPSNTINTVAGWPTNQVYRSSTLTIYDGGQHYYVYMNTGNAAFKSDGDVRSYHLSCLL